MKFFRKNWYFLVVLIFIVLAVIFEQMNSKQTNFKNDIMNTEFKKVLINSGDNKIEFAVEIADELIERSQGLMYRKSLEEGRGMLFIFEKVDYVNFWMKNTLISLDMIFIDENYKIAHIANEVKPCPEGVLDCPLYPSELPVKYVLEINAGLAKKYGFKNGDLIEFNL